MPRGSVSWTFDNMAEAAAVGRGEVAAPDPAGDNDLADAYPHLLATLDDAGVRATFFIEAWNAVHHPQAVAHLADRGHEVGAHGWVHEVWSTLGPHDEERLLVDSLAALRTTGVEPVAFRAPGGARTPITTGLLAAHGVPIDSSLTRDGFDEPSGVARRDGVVHVPYRWPQVDGYYYLHRRGQDPDPERSLYDTWRQLLSRAARTGEHLTFIAHASMSANGPGRLQRLAELIDHSAELGLDRLTVTEAAARSDRPTT